MTWHDNSVDQAKVVDHNEHRSSFTSVLMQRTTFVSIAISALLIAALLSDHSVGTAAQMPPPSSEAATPVVKTVIAPVPTLDPEADAKAYEKDRQMHMELDAKREQNRKDRDAAAARMQQAREDVQYFGQPQWSEVIYKNLQTFRALRMTAAQSGKTVECSICAGKSHLESCFLCNSTGKCRVCDGTGKRSYDETCPSCMGSGRCFLCAGSGKMLCPFCDDGMISADQHDPSSVLPIY